MNENMEQWLKSVGFSSNPFALYEAGSEKKLPHYFVSSPCFKKISGMPNSPESSVVFAPRGFGKTTQRIMLQHHCKTDTFKAYGRALAASFTDFESLPVPESPRDLTYTTRSYAFEIIHQAVSSLTDALLQDETITDRFRGLPDIDQTYLRLFIFTFKNNLSLERHSDLVQRGIHPFDQPHSDEGRSDLLKNKKFLTQHLKNCTNRSTAELINFFVKKINLLGYDSLYILVDRLDEFALPSYDYDAFIRLIQPLFNQLAIRNLPGVAFKFFLPGEWADTLFEKKLIREDRLKVQHVKWTHPLLAEILKKRLDAFHGPPDLGSLCEAGLSENIESEMVTLAEGSPRNLIRLGGFLFSEHCNLEQEIIEKKIRLKSWQEAKRHFKKIHNGECAPPLEGDDIFFPKC